MENYLALYIAIVWYREISPEQAFEILLDKSRMCKMKKTLTQEEIDQIKKTMSHYKFTDASWDRLEAKYRIDRYTISELIQK